MSAGPKAIFWRESLSSSSTLKWSQKSVTVQAGLGVANTLSYCVRSVSVVKSADGFSFPSPSRKGSTFALSSVLIWQKRRMICYNNNSDLLTPASLYFHFRTKLSHQGPLLSHPDQYLRCLIKFYPGTSPACDKSKTGQ